MTFHFVTLFLTFFLYSMMGWLFETIYCSLVHQSWDNRGMLNGPYCPIYGCGAIIAIRVCTHFNSPVLIFIVCALGSAVLEYVTSYLTEKFFHTVWWDYSYLPLNLNGRICLTVALGFGLGGLIVTYIIGPFVHRILSPVPLTVQEPLALLGMAVFAADLALTLDALTSLNQKLTAMEDHINESISERYDAFLLKTKQTFSNGFENVKEKVPLEELKEKISFEEFKEKFTKDEVKKLLPSLNLPQIHVLRSSMGFRKVNYSELGHKLKETILERKQKK